MRQIRGSNSRGQMSWLKVKVMRGVVRSSQWVLVLLTKPTPDRSSMLHMR